MPMVVDGNFVGPVAHRGRVTDIEIPIDQPQNLLCGDRLGWDF
ncbi:MAG: hypothetical protein R2793_04095 [Flavobacteriaceae bacterium]